MLPHHQGEHPLARTHRTDMLQLEFTTRCNFRCTYCAVAQPGWPGRDLDLDVGRLTAEAGTRGVRVLNLHGHGETTILPNWRELVAQAKATGARLMLCSNFGRPHTPEDTDAFAGLDNLTVSLDTVDPELFARLRRGGKLETLLDNLAKLRARTAELGRGPVLTFSVVLSDLSWRGLPDLARLGVDCGVAAIGLCNLHVLPTPKGGVRLRHVSELDPGEAAEVRRTLNACRAKCRRHGILLDVKSGILDTLDRRTADG